MESSNRQVTINDTPTKSKLYRFCEKKIDQWIRTRFVPRNLADLEFHVAFTEESDSKQISCVTEVTLGGSVWRGCDLATDTHMAFMHSLKRMQPH